MSIKNPYFSLLGSFFGDEKDKPFYLFHCLFLRLEIQNQSWSRGIFPWSGDGGEYFLFIEELLSKLN
jgi:hypothetical protein